MSQWAWNIKPSNVYGRATDVEKPEDFPEPVGGIITLPAGSSWILKAPIDLAGNRIVCAGTVALQGSKTYPSKSSKPEARTESMSQSALSHHAPGLAIAAASFFVPAAAEAVEPGMLPLGPDAPTWLGPLIMALGFLTREGIAFGRDWLAARREDKASKVESLEKENAKLKERLERAQDQELADERKIIKLEGELEVKEALHAIAEGSPKPTDGA